MEKLYQRRLLYTVLVMMLVLCMVLGIICSYVAIISGNCMYSAIVHGVINIIGEVPVFLSVRQENGLSGPNPSGLADMSFLIMCAVLLFVRLKKSKKIQVFHNYYNKLQLL